MEVSPGIIRIAVCNANNATNNVRVILKPRFVARDLISYFQSLYKYYVRKLFREYLKNCRKNPLHKMQGMKCDLDVRFVNRYVAESKHFLTECARVNIFGCRFKLINFCRQIID